MPETTTLAAVLRRDRVLVLSGVLGMTGFAWLHMIHMAWDMQAVCTEMMLSR